MFFVLRAFELEIAGSIVGIEGLAYLSWNAEPKNIAARYYLIVQFIGNTDMSVYNGAVGIRFGKLASGTVE